MGWLISALATQLKGLAHQSISDPVKRTCGLLICTSNETARRGNNTPMPWTQNSWLSASHYSIDSLIMASIHLIKIIAGVTKKSAWILRTKFIFWHFPIFTHRLLGICQVRPVLKKFFGRICGRIWIRITVKLWGMTPILILLRILPEIPPKNEKITPYFGQDLKR